MSVRTRLRSRPERQSGQEGELLQPPPTTDCSRSSSDLWWRAVQGGESDESGGEAR